MSPYVHKDNLHYIHFRNINEIKHNWTIAYAHGQLIDFMQFRFEIFKKYTVFIPEFTILMHLFCFEKFYSWNDLIIHLFSVKNTRGITLNTKVEVPRHVVRKKCKLGKKLEKKKYGIKNEYSWNKKELGKVVLLMTHIKCCYFTSFYDPTDICFIYVVRFLWNIANFFL